MIPDPSGTGIEQSGVADLQPDFLSGGGECAARMRAVDWSRTALGPPQYWPRSLKTIVRMMLDSRYAMWMLWGPELTFFCNDAYLPTVGIKRDWVMGERSDKVWAEIWPDIGPRIESVMVRGEATWDEGLLLFLERSGFPEETYHTFSYSPIHDDENLVAGMLCVVTETTERVLAERGLSVLRDLASRVPGATVDQALRRAMEVLHQDQIDAPFASLYLLEEAQGVARLAAGCGEAPATLCRATVPLEGTPDALTRVLQGQPAEVVHLQAPDLVPSPLWPEPLAQALILPLRGTRDAVAGALAVGISPRRKFDAGYRQFFELAAGQISSVLADAQAYEAERRRAESLAELDRAKTQFFSNVSHEFRTPLTLMLGPVSEALEDPELTPALRERLQLAQRNAQRLLRLVNSLLDFSRIEAGRVQATYEPTDIASLTRDLASTFRSAVERAGLDFDVETGSLSEPVWLDRDMWEKIVLNLLSNAYKFTLEGGIRLRLTEEDHGAVLEVTDSGVGVPEDSLPRLFERFYRIENSGGRAHEGSGIGLALVQELVRLHGGTIEVASRIGAGTSFRVRLPFGSAHLPAEHLGRAHGHIAPGKTSPLADEVEGWSHEPAAASIVARGSADPRFESTFGARVLLADDNADMRAYVLGLLAPAYRVEVTVDGQAALEAARRERPDLIVSDVMMPRLDGFGLIQNLRQDAHLRDVPVILLSARAGEESRIEGLDAGADDYLVKPFSARELGARVGALLERTRLHRQVLQEQRNIREQLELADRQKDDFLAMLAHELRNPLAPIRTAAELLKRTTQPDERARGAIDIVKRQVGYLTRLVDDLLDISRITRAHIELKRQDIALTDVIAQALETVEPLLREKGHHVSTTSDLAPLLVNGDPARLVQCVSNLLTNAIKYTDARGQIRIESRADGEHALVTVSDNGTGIAPELLPHVFDLFVQSQRTLDRAQGGLGIGLSVVKRLVEMHGGVVSARSDGAGQGASFSIRLPRIIRAERAVAASDSPRSPARRVLVVDDNQDAAESLAMLMSMDGHVVDSAFSSAQALQQAARFRPDVVLLDIGLPGMDGYEVARHMRAMPGGGAMRLIALTGYGQMEDRRRALEAGFDEHFVKPVDPGRLQAALRAT